MLKKLMLTTALTSLMLGGAVAQSTLPPSTPNATTAPATTSSGSPQTVGAQQPDQWLASKFTGTDVVGADDKKIGDVADILFDKEGKIDAYVVSVGGFLGVGSKEVALAPSSFTVVKGENGGYDKLKLSMSVDELKAASNFERYNPPRTTTGMGSPGANTMTRPAGAPPAPAR